MDYEHIDEIYTMSIEDAADLAEDEQTNRIFQQWLSNDKNIIEKIQNIEDASQKLIDVQQNERLPIISPIYHRNYSQSQTAIDQIEQSQRELIKKQNDTQLQNNKIKHNPNLNLIAIIDQEVNNRSIEFSLCPSKSAMKESMKLIYDQQNKEIENLIQQQKNKDFKHKQESIQHAIDVLNEELRLHDLESCDHNDKISSLNEENINKVVIASSKEAKRRQMAKQLRNINDQALQIRNFEYIQMLTQSWQIGAEKLLKQQQMIISADKKISNANVKEVNECQDQEQQSRIAAKAAKSGSNEIISIIGYPELNFLTEIEVIERQKECMEFLLTIAQKCDKLMKLNKNTKLLEIWNKRQRQLIKRGTKCKMDWILYAKCKNLLDKKKSRLLKQLKQLWHLYRITVTNKTTKKVTSNKYSHTHISFIPRKSPTISRARNGRSISNISTPSLSPTKQKSFITISAHYSTPTFTFQSKIKPENVRNKVHKKTKSIKLFKPTKNKIKSKTENRITVNTNDLMGSMTNKSTIDLSKYVSPINQYLEMQNKAFLNVEDDKISSIQDGKKAFQVHEEHKKTPNKKIFERLSKPKRINIRHIATESMKRDIVEATKPKLVHKETKPVDSEVFDKLYKDARIRKTRHEIAKGLSDSARLANIKSMCSFQPKLYKSQAIVNLENDAIPVHQRMKQWEIRREKNLQKLIENDPMRKHCTFQPDIRGATPPIYDYSHPT